MKIKFTLAILLFLISSIASAQKVMRIKNLQTGDPILNIEHGLSCTQVCNSWVKARWFFKKAPFGSNLYWIQNASDTTLCLNVENGSVACSKIEEDWVSARWILEAVSERPDFRRIKNSLNNKYLNFEQGLQCTAIEDYWASAKWVIQYVPLSTEPCPLDK